MKEYLDNTRRIYEHLADEESKVVFVNRCLYNMTGDSRFLKVLEKQYKPFKNLKEFIDKNRNGSIYIYGAGNYGQYIASLFDNVAWEKYIDNRKYGTKVGEIWAINEEEFLKSNHSNSAIIISMVSGYEEVEKGLLEKGIRDTQIFALWKEINNIREPYFEEFIPCYEEEVFVDAGVYNGDTSLEFVKWTKNNYKKIYMFEPSKEYFVRYGNKVSDLENCHWIEKGLWSEKTTLRLFERYDSDICVEKNLDGIEEKYSVTEGEWIDIPVTSLDEELGDEKVTFIKMDIEGAELEALKGAENIIKRNRPKLAICLYHKLEDPWVLPEYILNLCPDYKLYIRHWSMDMLDTILYAI